MTRTLFTTRDRGVATITLCRPGRKNSITPLMCAELHDEVRAISQDDSVHVVVLTGDGDVFSPGGDIGAILDPDSVDDFGDGTRLDFYDVPQLLRTMPQLAIAAINGACAGAALGWALACDLRIATSSAKLTTAFLARGIAGDMAIPWTLPRLVGPAVARELSFLTPVLSGTEAARMGLVNRDVEDLPTALEEWLTALRAVPPAACRQLKQHYLLAERTSLGDYAAYEARVHTAGFDLAGFEGVLRGDD